MRSIRREREGSIYYVNESGLFHNEYGPAIILKNGYKSWWIHGKRHRLDGPAVEYNGTNGSDKWFYHGTQIHCSSQEEFNKLIKLKEYW